MAEDPQFAFLLFLIKESMFFHVAAQCGPNVTQRLNRLSCGAAEEGHRTSADLSLHADSLYPQLPVHIQNSMYSTSLSLHGNSACHSSQKE